MAEELTPMQRQYLALKREIPPGAILMFRLGDFYEMFDEDARIASIWALVMAGRFVVLK